MEARLRKFYVLETEAYTLSRQREEVSARLAQAKYDHRQAKAAVLEYEGSFRSFLDKLSGRKEAKAEELNRTLRRAEAELSALTREQEALAMRKEKADAELKTLPSREEFLAEPALSRLLHRLDALLCLKKLMPELEENYDALLALRDQLQGKNHTRIMSIIELQDIYSRPDTAGEKCRLHLERLEADLNALDIPFPIPDYYRAPNAYINAVASDALRRDRVNLALDQVLDMKKHAAKLLERMEDAHG